MRDSTVKISRSPPFLPYTDKHTNTFEKYINRREEKKPKYTTNEPTNQKKRPMRLGEENAMMAAVKN